MTVKEKIIQRFSELETKIDNIRLETSVYDTQHVESGSWEQWATSVLSLLQSVFGPNSSHYTNFKKIYNTFTQLISQLNGAKGVFFAAKEDFEGGYLFNLETSISGEIFGDFVAAAKNALMEGNKEVAAVLASAALEDALKRFAKLNGHDVDGKDMSTVVSLLKSKGLVGGAQKTLLETMPKLRNFAMHAQWDKFNPEDVSSIIGFVEQFLLTKFSE